jgi:uncharacterized membrane protein
VTELRHRAADAYLVWPLAAIALLREQRGEAAWSRLHVRQAFVFGLLAALAYLVLLALPLLAVIAFPGIGTSAVVWLYAAGMLADLCGAFLWIGLSFTFRERAARGELFAIPVVTPIAQGVFRLEHDS